jgi:hypothetical protein
VTSVSPRFRRRCDDYIAEGVTQVWLLDPNLKRACTVTRTEGLREFKGAVLQVGDPPLEMDLTRIFGSERGSALAAAPGPLLASVLTQK